MKIAIDLSVLQTGHRFRGVGAVVTSFIKHLPAVSKKEHDFVFFLKNEDNDELFDALDLQDVNYDIRYIKPSRPWPGKNNIGKRIVSNIIGRLEYINGDERISKSQLSDIDHFIQFEQNSKLPKNAHKHTTLVLYDLIPFIMESDYLWSYKTARLHGRSRKAAFKAAIQRYEYLYKLRINCKRAKNLIAISEHTKRDFIKYVGVKDEKITVCYLGSDSYGSSTPSHAKRKNFKAFESNSWGTIRRSVTVGTKPFLLFVGGADPRRKLAELYAAFTNLRARGVEISLIFAGDTMTSPADIEHEMLNKYIHENPSYKRDVHFLGYVSDDQREWLYSQALAYVYPSVYEGFGLPILEAMKYGTPVITYKNSSIEEVAGDDAMYADGPLEIVHHVQSLLTTTDLLKQYARRGKERAERFSWKITSESIINYLQNN